MNNRFEREFLVDPTYKKQIVCSDFKIQIKKGYINHIQKGMISKIQETKYQSGLTKFEHTTTTGEHRNEVNSHKVKWDMNRNESQKIFESCGDCYLKMWQHIFCCLGNAILEINQFIEIKSKPCDLIIAKIIFNTEKEALAFVPQKWMRKEITNKSKWSEFSLCVNGIPY